jgi:hypothetical protein
MGTHYSLLQTFVNYDRKKFYKIRPRKEYKVFSEVGNLLERIRHTQNDGYIEGEIEGIGAKSGIDGPSFARYNEFFL